MSDKNEDVRSNSTFKALVEDKKRGRGRPRHVVSRQSVYVEIAPSQKKLISDLGKQLVHLKRADVPDMCIMALSTRLEAMRNAVSDRARELPEGIQDMDSFYYLWDLDVPLKNNPFVKWTSTRLSPQQKVQIGRLQGTLHALFAANRSDVFLLALSLFAYLTQNYPEILHFESIEQYQFWLNENFL